MSTLHEPHKQNALIAFVGFRDPSGKISAAGAGT
jgi:hypothetical protein